MDDKEMEGLKARLRALSDEDKMKLGLEFELGKETRKLVWWWIALPFIALGVAGVVMFVHTLWIDGRIAMMLVPMCVGAAVGAGIAGGGVARGVGDVAGAVSSYEATRYQTDRRLLWEKYQAEQKRLGDQYVSEQARAGRERAAQYGMKGQVESARYGYRGQVRAAEYGYGGQVGAATTRAAGGVMESGMQVGGNVVVAGFGQFNAAQRMGTQWAYRSNEPRDVMKRFLVASVLFVGGLFVLALGMDWFGFPILKNLIDLVVETVMSGIARANVIQSLADAGDIEGARAWMTTTGGAAAGGFIGVCQRFFEGIMNFFAKAGAAVANALGSFGNVVSGAIP